MEAGGLFMPAHIQLIDDFVVLTFANNLLAESWDEDTQETLQTHLDDNFKNCVVDLSKVHFINSTGINVLVKVLTLFRNAGGEVVLVNISPAVQKLLIVTKLQAIFSVFEKFEDAKIFLKNEIKL